MEPGQLVQELCMCILLIVKLIGASRAYRFVNLIWFIVESDSKIPPSSCMLIYEGVYASFESSRVAIYHPHLNLVIL